MLHHYAAQLTAAISCPLTTSFVAGLEGVGEAAPAGPSAVAGMAKQTRRVAPALGAGGSHGASAPAEQQQQPWAAAAQPAASNAAVASPKVGGAKRKAPAGADLAGPSGQEPAVLGVQAAARCALILTPTAPGVGRQQCMHIWSLALPALCTSGASRRWCLLKVVHAVQSLPVVHPVFLLFPNCPRHCACPRVVLILSQQAWSWNRSTAQVSRSVMWSFSLVMLQAQPVVEQLQQQTLRQLLVRPSGGVAPHASLPVQTSQAAPWLLPGSSSSPSLLVPSQLPVCLQVPRTGQPWEGLPRPLMHLPLLPQAMCSFLYQVGGRVTMCSAVHLGPCSSQSWVPAPRHSMRYFAGADCHSDNLSSSTVLVSCALALLALLCLLG